jgi:hypothetical protein
MQRKMISGESVKKTLLKDVAVASFFVHSLQNDSALKIRWKAVILF